MDLSPKEKAEKQRLATDVGGPVFHSWNYDYNQAKDLYQAKDDKHEFHAGADVRRLEMLIMKEGA